jgi:hypothetical protein
LEDRARKGCTRAKTEMISMEMESGAFVINERILALVDIYTCPLPGG